jgi:hypothetical protein
MAAKRPAGSQKPSLSPRPKAKSSRKRPMKAKRKRTGREALSESREHELLQKTLSQQQLFRGAIEDSANLLRQAAESALKSIREQSHQAVSEPLAGDLPGAPDDPLKPLTDQFVKEAYKRAKEMFEGIGAGVGPGGPSTPQIPFPPPGGPADRWGDEALATSALLMNQATQYLNQAINSVMKEMDRRLTGQADNISHLPPPPRPKRPS